MSCPFAQIYLGLSFINTAAADTFVSCPFAQIYLSGRDMFKRSSVLYSSSSGTFTACSEARAGDHTLAPLLYFPAGDQTLTP